MVGRDMDLSARVLIKRAKTRARNRKHKEPKYAHTIDNETLGNQVLNIQGITMTLTFRFIDIFRNLYQGSCCCVRIEEGVMGFFAI